MNLIDNIKTTPVPTHSDRELLWKSWRKRRKKLCQLFQKIMAIYLDDLLMLAGCACFVGGAALKWGAAEALGVCGVCLTACAVIVARGGIGRR